PNVEGRTREDGARSGLRASSVSSRKTAKASRAAPTAAMTDPNRASVSAHQYPAMPRAAATRKTPTKPPSGGTAASERTATTGPAPHPDQQRQRQRQRGGCGRQRRTDGVDGGPARVGVHVGEAERDQHQQGPGDRERAHRAQERGRGGQREGRARPDREEIGGG